VVTKWRIALIKIVPDQIEVVPILASVKEKPKENLLKIIINKKDLVILVIPVAPVDQVAQKNQEDQAVQEVQLDKNNLNKIGIHETFFQITIYKYIFSYFSNYFFVYNNY